ncbi:hypothetical protein EV363DRAFT_1307880 [Boletus edulis]|nr:hypothetical protein EV363DRAFT_1307880 [Boletus edulis]
MTSQPTNSDAAGVFYDHVFNYMPAHLLHIDNSGIRLIHREDLHQIFRPDHATGQEIALLMAKSPNRSREAAIRQLVAQKLKYAILSHRWLLEGEQTFQKVMENGLDGDSLGCTKLRQFCAIAEALGCSLAWADTCCIDKTSSAELDEAIRSMFKWYRNSAVCVVLLAEATSQDSIRDDPWFTRGWTLQELLAPATIKFYGADWSPLSTFSNDKENIEMMHIISEITHIDHRDLRYFSPGLLNVREKMRWASSRKTTRVEDVAYSLLGIFDISMPIAYGEGKRAFRRLMEVIANECREWQIFAWAGPHSPYSTAFPESPSGYRALSDATNALMPSPGRSLHPSRPWDLRVGYPFYAMTKKGLKMEVLVIEMMLHIDREPIEGTIHERLTLSPSSENEGSFEKIEVACDTRFLLFSRWAVGIINYQTDGAGTREGMAELEAGREYICLFLGTGIYTNYREWEKVETKEVLTIRTKEVFRKRVTTVWL